jgi:hypothetical protein
MKSKILVVLVAFMLASVASAGVITAFPDVIDFEVGVPDLAPVPQGYADMGWSGDFYGMNADAYGTPSGYTTMGTYVAFNAFAATPIDFWSQNGDEFDVISLDFIAAWWTSLTYTVNGYRDGGLEYSKDLTVDCYNVTTFDLNFTDVDRLEFVYKSGSGVSGWDGGDGQHFVLDNIVLVPAPGALGLLGLGLLGRRRR